jgi:hypothetical protein
MNETNIEPTNIYSHTYTTPCELCKLKHIGSLTEEQLDNYGIDLRAEDCLMACDKKKEEE